MSRPFRRYCFTLGIKLGKSLKEIMELDSSEIMEWMAYDLSETEGFYEKWEVEKTKDLTHEQQAEMFKALLGKR